jgi:23S rRNA pseudouridine2605 synthase
MIKIAEGVELEDGFIMPDEITYAEDGGDKKKIGIQIHSGRNRIVRRIFERFGYEIKKLDRVVFANLTKKDIPRGKWRHLTQTEINILRRIN